MAHQSVLLPRLALSFALCFVAGNLSTAFSADAPLPVGNPIKANAQWEEGVPQAGAETPSLNGDEASKKQGKETHYSSQLTSDFPEKEWWTQFNDPFLSQYISDALRDSPRLEASVYRIQQARAQVTKAFAGQLPSLGFSPSYARLGLPSGLLGGGGLSGAIQTFVLSFMPSYQVDLFGQNANKTKSAKTELKATELDSRAVLVSLQGEVAAAYFNLLRADASVNTQQENLTLLRRINALKRSQHSAGLTSYDEVIRSERDVALALTNFNSYVQQQATFAHQLAVLTGRPPQSEKSLTRGTLETAKLPIVTPIGSPEQLLTRRPDIAAQEARLKRAAIDVRVARKDFLPKLNFTGLFATAGGKVGDVLNVKDNFTNIQLVQLSQPIQVTQQVGEVRYQKARQKEQIANYRQTILTAMKEVEDQLSSLKANYDTLNSNSQRLELTQQALRITEDQQKQGLIPRLNVLQAQSELIQYQQLGAQSKSDAAIATVNLYKALGGGF